MFGKLQYNNLKKESFVKIVKKVVFLKAKVNL